MIPITSTENFVYGVSLNVMMGGIGDSFSRVMALAATCEADFHTLQKLFRSSGGFGPHNKVQVIIETSIAAKGAAGWNGGYHDNGKTQIQIVPFNGDADGDAEARAVFVHEMAEVLMSYGNKKHNGKWIENYSTGEALAQICAAELHPEGYGGPRITQWLNLPYTNWPVFAVRPNWIDKTEATDGNPWSSGCGIVFLNYLRWQRNFALDEIIARGDDTLAKTYRNLTGQTDGWSSFSDLMNTHFPFGRNYSPTTDNLFPLPQLASLEISPATIETGGYTNARLSLTAAHPGSDVTADLICGDPGFARLPTPPIVTIKQNETYVEFMITSQAINVPFKPAEVIIYATSGGVTVAGKLTVTPHIKTGILKSVTLNPAVVTGGETSAGTVTLEDPVAGKTLVSLAAVETGGPFPRPGDASSVAHIRNSTVTIDEGKTTGNFIVQTDQVSPNVTRTATILAHSVVTKSALLKVEGG